MKKRITLFLIAILTFFGAIAYAGGGAGAACKIHPDFCGSPK